MQFLVKPILQNESAFIALSKRLFDSLIKPL